MTEYVLCYCGDLSSVLTIEKEKPDWQRGKINLPGGKIEEGETPTQAAARELFEKTDLVVFHGYEIGQLVGDGWKVHVVGCVHKGQLKQKTNERVKWSSLDVLENQRLIPNLKLIIPLCYHQVHGWTIHEQDNRYTITL